MIGFKLARDRIMGGRGFVAAVAGPTLLAVGVTLIALLARSVVPGSSEIVLIFGINAVMVVGFQVFIGNTGIVSFGHIAFMAVGAYAGGIAAIPVADKSYVLPDLPGFLGNLEVGILPALLIGGLAAAAAALIAGLGLMRLVGAAASIATLGLLVIVNNVLGQATSITRGPQSLFGIPSYTTFFWVFAALVVVVAVSAAFKWSRWGLRARAVRDDPVAAESSGVSVFSSRIWAFTLSAFIVGVGGALYAQLLTAFSPESFFLPQLVVVLTMAIVGGINSISGALAGATVVTVATELLRRVETGFTLGGTEIKAATGISQAVLGIALILMLYWRPEGFTGAAEVQLSEPPRRKGATEATSGRGGR